MRTRWMLVWLAVGFAAPAAAIDVASGRLTLSGFGEWGYGVTSNDNYYLVGGPDGRYENARFGLTVTARPAADLVVAGQVVLASAGVFDLPGEFQEATLDWGFAEYRVSDRLRIRVGKVKNPLGLFMEVKQIGTLRPFFTLPQSVYGPANFAADAYLGAGVTGEWQGREGWGAAWDAYAGALEIPSFEPGNAVLVSPSPPWDFAGNPSVAIHDDVARDVVGGRVALLTPFDGLTARVSAFTGTLAQVDPATGLDRGDERIVCFGLSGEWVLERFELRGEWFRATEGSSETHLGGYAEVAWKFLPTLQVALRFDESHQIVDGGVPAALLEHHETAAGLSWWPSPNLVLKASYHYVEQNRFAVPASTPPDGALDATTDLYLVGAQFSF